MITQILSDLVPFIIVLAAQVWVFSVVFLQLELEGEEFVTFDPEEYPGFRKGWRSYVKTWDFMLGYSEYRFKTGPGVIIYILGSIIINISILNMVISVVSDSYDRV